MKANPFQLVIAALNLLSMLYFIYQHKWIPAGLSLTWTAGSVLVAFL